jgi:hypothetical protein
MSTVLHCCGGRALHANPCCKQTWLKHNSCKPCMCLLCAVCPPGVSLLLSGAADSSIRLWAWHGKAHSPPWQCLAELKVRSLQHLHYSAASWLPLAANMQQLCRTLQHAVACVCSCCMDVTHGVSMQCQVATVLRGCVPSISAATVTFRVVLLLMQRLLLLLLLRCYRRTRAL